VGGIRNPRVCLTAAAAIGAIAIAGCGGGGDDNTSTSANATVPQVTSPGQFNPGGARTPTAPEAPGNNSGGPAAQGNLPPGAQPVQQALAPFRECLQQHDVTLPFLNRSGSQAQRREFQQNPQQYRDQAQKAFACIPKLPPQLRATAERFKRRFEQRNG
jgi:hypothetical protein